RIIADGRRPSCSEGLPVDQNGVAKGSQTKPVPGVESLNECDAPYAMALALGPVSVTGRSHPRACPPRTAGGRSRYLHRGRRSGAEAPPRQRPPSTGSARGCVPRPQDSPPLKDASYWSFIQYIT